MKRSDPNTASTSADTLELIRRLEASKGAVCHSCQQPLCAHQVLASIALGAGGAPRCLTCLAAALEQPLPELVASVSGYIQGRECFKAALDWANSTETPQSSGTRCCPLES